MDVRSGIQAEEWLVLAGAGLQGPFPSKSVRGLRSLAVADNWIAIGGTPTTQFFFFLSFQSCIILFADSFGWVSLVDPRMGLVTDLSLAFLQFFEYIMIEKNIHFSNIS